jgi:hypothetical protein
MARAKPPETKQKQLPISLTPHLRRELEAAAAKSGVSLGEEVRQRLFKSFADETVNTHTRELADAVIRFALDVKQETGREWYAHPAANRALRFAVTTRLARLKPEGDDTFRADELPNNRIITSSEDPQAIGQTLEAFDFKTYSNQDLLEKHPELRKDHEHD